MKKCSAWERVTIARNPLRATSLDYIEIYVIIQQVL